MSLAFLQIGAGIGEKIFFALLWRIVSLFLSFHQHKQLFRTSDRCLPSRMTLKFSDRSSEGGTFSNLYKTKVAKSYHNISRAM